jgi:hypothetical protein
MNGNHISFGVLKASNSQWCELFPYDLRRNLAIFIHVLAGFGVRYVVRNAVL